MACEKQGKDSIKRRPDSDNALNFSQIRKESILTELFLRLGKRLLRSASGTLCRQEAILAKKTGILILIILGVIGSMVDDDSDTTISASKSEKSKSENQTTYKQGETVSTGYTSYAVWSSWWSSRLSDNQFLDDRPNAMFLFVDITVRNDDKKPRSIPPFYLIDENGAEYETSSKAWAVEGAIGILESLNPDVQKRGLIVFDVPQNNRYKLKVSGGYWSEDDAFIVISPK